MGHRFRKRDFTQAFADTGYYLSSLMPKKKSKNASFTRRKRNTRNASSRFSRVRPRGAVKARPTYKRLSKRRYKKKGSIRSLANRLERVTQSPHFVTRFGTTVLPLTGTVAVNQQAYGIIGNLLTATDYAGIVSVANGSPTGIANANATPTRLLVSGWCSVDISSAVNYPIIVSLYEFVAKRSNCTSPTSIFAALPTAGLNMGGQGVGGAIPATQYGVSPIFAGMLMDWRVAKRKTVRLGAGETFKYSMTLKERQMNSQNTINHPSDLYIPNVSRELFCVIRSLPMAGLDVPSAAGFQSGKIATIFKERYCWRIDQQPNQTTEALMTATSAYAGTMDIVTEDTDAVAVPANA